MAFKHFLIGTLFLFISSSYSQFTVPKFGDGMLNVVGKDSTSSVGFAPRIQFRAESQWNYGEDKFGKPEQNFTIRRARLKFDGFAYTPKLKYKIELGLSNQDLSGANEFTADAPRLIYDAIIKWEFLKNTELLVGQTKLPGNRERVVSSANMQFVDRSILNSNFNIDRDLGFQLRHQFRLTENFVVREIFALSQGEGRNVVTGNLGGHQYTSRLEILPFGEFTKNGDYVGGDIYKEKSPKLSIAATYDLNVDAVKTRSNMGNYMRNDTGFFETNITTVFVDGMFKYAGFSAMAEFSYRKAHDALAKNSDGTLTGDEVYEGAALNLQGGYVFPSNWEIAGRFSAIWPERDFLPNKTEGQYTLGVSKYLVGHHLKFQTDITYGTLGSAHDFIEYRMGFDLYF